MKMTGRQQRKKSSYDIMQRNSHTRRTPGKAHWLRGIFTAVFLGMLLLSGGCGLLDAGEKLVELIPIESSSGEQAETPLVEESFVAEKFHYRQLPEEAKPAYRQIVHGIETLSERFTVEIGGVEQAHKVFNCVLNDYPEYFWLDGDVTIWENSLSEDVELEPEYNRSAEEIPAVRGQIDGAAQEFLNTVSDQWDTYAKIKAAYEYIIRNTDYSEASEQNQNIQSVFLNRVSVCAGYAKAFQYLMDKMEIPCIYVEGTVAPDNTPHAWNMVAIDGNYYQIDCTWGDPNYRDTAEQARMSILYDYFCVTSEELYRTHTPIADYAYPDCVDAGYNYYAQFSHYYDTYDESQVLQAAWDTINNGESRTFLKFTNQAAYEQAKSAIDAGDILSEPAREKMSREGLTEYQYYYDFSENMYIIKIYW